MSFLPARSIKRQENKFSLTSVKIAADTGVPEQMVRKSQAWREMRDAREELFPKNKSVKTIESSPERERFMSSYSSDDRRREKPSYEPDEYRTSALAELTRQQAAEMEEESKRAKGLKGRVDERRQT